MRRLVLGTVLACVAVSAAPAQKGASSVPLNPGFGDLMEMLVQPRHMKLGLAGQQANWPLADYELKQLRQAFGRITGIYPMFRSQPIGLTIDSIMDEPFKITNAAIEAKDTKAFGNGYAAITAACNACHTALEHSFVVIKTPDASAFPDQEFKPAK